MKNTGDFILLDKSVLKELTLKDISIQLPDLKNIFESKAIVIANWLIEWIDADFKSSKIKENDLLPKKAEFAYHLGVSIGTMQNAFRIIEDKGYVESKQCLGTMVRDRKKPSTTLRKLTSKRDVSINLLKKYILDNKVKVGQKLPSSRFLAALIGSSANTTRLALENLCSVGIIDHQFKASNDSSWILKSNTFTMPRAKSAVSTNVTLVEQVQKDLENYITKNLKVGDRIPAHENLSKELKVSIKTIHDALKSLIKNGVLLALRGRYGTTVIKMPNESAFSPRKETSIFASAQETAFYNYEKTQNHIKEIIAQNYEIGSKLPSIVQLSKELDLSPNTIRKAFNNLAIEGYLRFERGRYGGTFVMDIPETSSHSFKWLAVSPKYVRVY